MSYCNWEMWNVAWKLITNINYKYGDINFHVISDNFEVVTLYRLLAEIPHRCKTTK